jgi:hypothetical protein
VTCKFDLCEKPPITTQLEIIQVFELPKNLCYIADIGNFEVNC